MYAKLNFKKERSKNIGRENIQRDNGYETRNIKKKPLCSINKTEPTPRPIVIKPQNYKHKGQPERKDQCTQRITRDQKLTCPQQQCKPADTGTLASAAKSK